MRWGIDARRNGKLVIQPVHSAEGIEALVLQLQLPKGKPKFMQPARTRVSDIFVGFDGVVGRLRSCRIGKYSKAIS